MFKRSLLKFYSLAFFILLEGLHAKNESNNGIFQITAKNDTKINNNNNSETENFGSEINHSDKVIFNLGDLFLDPEGHGNYFFYSVAS